MARRSSRGLRTRKGNVTAKARRKYGKGKGPKGKRFPIFDKKSARSALRLRGHARSAAERSSIIRRAARYLPGAARKAREADRKRRRKK
jgi:hypothetical protein